MVEEVVLPNAPSRILQIFIYTLPFPYGTYMCGWNPLKKKANPMKKKVGSKNIHGKKTSGRMWESEAETIPDYFIISNQSKYFKFVYNPGWT